MGGYDLLGDLVSDPSLEKRLLKRAAEIYEAGCAERSARACFKAGQVHANLASTPPEAVRWFKQACALRHHSGCSSAKETD